MASLAILNASRLANNPRVIKEVDALSTACHEVEVLGWAQKHPEAVLAATSPEPELLVPLLDRLRNDGDLRVQLAAGASGGEGGIRPGADSGGIPKLFG